MEQVVQEHSTVTANKNQVSCDLAGEAAILDLKTGVYYGLDAVGARIWELIQEPKKVTEVRDTLLQEFEVEADRCQSDLLALLQEMSTHGLVEICDEQAA